MNDFRRDDAWQKQVRDTVLGPGFYGVFAVDGRYVLVDKGRLASILQKRYAVDTVVQGKNGNAYCIEEKIVRWPGYKYAAYTLETDSCTVPGHESQGWMHYGQADFLIYCFHQENGDLDCHLIDFPKLQDWFWQHVDEFEDFQMETRNRTKGKKVPIAAVQAAVPTWHRYVYAPPCNEVA